MASSKLSHLEYMPTIALPTPMPTSTHIRFERERVELLSHLRKSKNAADPKKGGQCDLVNDFQ